MVADYLKKFQKQAQALALDASYDALDQLLKKLNDLSWDVSDLLPVVKELRDEIKTSLMVSAAPAAPAKTKKAKDPKAPKGALKRVHVLQQ